MLCTALSYGDPIPAVRRVAFREESDLIALFRDRTFIDPTYDSSFKYVFATEGESEPILANLLNDVLHLDGDQAIKTLIYKSVEQVIDRDGGRRLILDLLVTDQREHSYNVEI